MSDWKTLSTTPIEENEHLRFFVDEFDANGRKGKYFYHMNPNGDQAVNIVAQKDDNTFIMIREYRYLFNRWSLTIPQGSIEKGESADEAAKREVTEESGYEPGKMTYLGWHAAAPAFSKEKAELYLAQDLKHVGQHLDGVEEIEVVEMTADEIDAAIASGEIWDGQAITGWYMVKAHLSKR